MRDITDQPAFIFPGLFMSGHEDELAGMAAGAKIMHVPGSQGEVMLEQARVADEGGLMLGRQGEDIGIAIALACAALVIAGEFLRRFIDDFPGHAARLRIDDQGFEP